MCSMRSNKREKDVMFDEKRRVVLLKTTCRLLVNVGTEVAVGRKCEKKSNTRGRRKGECDTCDSKNQHRCWKEGVRTHARVRVKEVCWITM